MSRSKRDFGTIRRRAAGGTRRSTWGRTRTSTGAPSTFQTRADAEAWLAHERRLIQDDTWSPTRSRRAKVARTAEASGPYAAAWLSQRDLKPRTRALYQRLLERFLPPEFEHVALRDITPAVVRVWHAGLDPHRPTQGAHAYALLRSILATAVADEILAANPCRVRGGGTTTRARRVEPATLDQLTILVAHTPDRYQALVLLGAWCGLRFGEMAELRRADLDLATGVVHVRRGVVRTNGQVTVGAPKSAAGVRDVAIPPHPGRPPGHPRRTRARGAGLSLGHPDPEVQVHPNTLYRHWHKAREAAGRPDLRIHDLRHTGAVLAARTGATLAELMARIGHSTPRPPSATSTPPSAATPTSPSNSPTSPKPSHPADSRYEGVRRRGA